MKKTTFLTLAVIALFWSCSTEDVTNATEELNFTVEKVNFTAQEVNLTQKSQTRAECPGYQCPYVLLVEYDPKRVELSDIPGIRASYFNGGYGDCAIVSMHILQPSDPYRDAWLVEFPGGCYPDEDTDDLDTTIDNDPRVNVLPTGS